MTKEEFLSGIEFYYKSEIRDVNKYRYVVDCEYIETCCNQENFCNIDINKTNSRAAYGYTFLLGKFHKLIFEFDMCIPVASKNQKATEKVA